ncbi:MAG: hypothetical protein HC895_10700 [Leptolyngbyaceae cyanobacterium SM1_3_5]|nr:hypothetical protein [Leptolyngbyaceae cyanobacterium SM1_3_5]
MSQEVHVNPSVLDEIDAPASTRAEPDPIDLLGDGNFPVDSYANRLMDELFGEVDRIFEGGGLPVETPVPEVVSLQPIAIPQLEVPDLPVELAPIESASQIATPDAEAIATLEPAADRSCEPLAFWRRLLPLRSPLVCRGSSSSVPPLRLPSRSVVPSPLRPTSSL